MWYARWSSPEVQDIKANSQRIPSDVRGTLFNGRSTVLVMVMGWVDVFAGGICAAHRSSDWSLQRHNEAHCLGFLVGILCNHSLFFIIPFEMSLVEHFKQT